MLRNLPFRCLIAMASLVGGAGTAQAQSILAGEHADFTRIAIRKIGQTEPHLETAEDSIRVIGAAAVGTSDLTSALQKLGRARVQGIEIDSSGVRVDLNCECKAETFDYRGYYVIDIAEGKEPVAQSAAPHPDTAFQEWKIPKTSILASCSVGAWCQDLLSIEPEIDNDDYCQFASETLVNLTALQGSAAPQAERLRAYLDKGWWDEAALLIDEMSAGASSEPFIRTGQAEADDHPACASKQETLAWVKTRELAIDWTTQAEPAQDPEMIPIADAPEQEPEPEVPALAVTSVNADSDVHTRALSFLESYKAELE
ncbi:hypothetical protein [Donghicola sp.]|jgi:hypothetical protein|uniref:hypothetical protein n=1 Tax=Donghicola sp. TaxID=1929294 RepID=UPI0025F2D4F9|nr:hypothetical protein [Donghicola sp.]MCT4578563.1 hypothetical protein [Donghicola sp.]